MGQLGVGDDNSEGVKKVMEMAEGEEIVQIEAGMVHSALLVRIIIYILKSLNRLKKKKIRWCIVGEVIIMVNWGMV